MEKIDLFSAFLYSSKSEIIEIKEQQIENLERQVKEMKEQYTLKANNSLISASSVFLNR